MTKTTTNRSSGKWNKPTAEAVKIAAIHAEFAKWRKSWKEMAAESFR